MQNLIYIFLLIMCHPLSSLLWNCYTGKYATDSNTQKIVHVDYITTPPSKKKKDMWLVLFGFTQFRGTT